MINGIRIDCDEPSSDKSKIRVIHIDEVTHKEQLDFDNDSSQKTFIGGTKNIYHADKEDLAN
ncbi:MAG: hypothetical protein MHMPM18_002801 [Marteilia pararefringens]